MTQAANCQQLSRYKNSTVFEGCIFNTWFYSSNAHICPWGSPSLLLLVVSLVWMVIDYFWHLQLEQEKEIFYEHESGKQAREKNAKWTSKIDQKIDYLPTHVPCTFYWKSINSQPLQFLLKLFPLSGSLVIIYCPAQPQKIINEERIAKELRRRTKWNVKVSTFCLLAVPELQKLIFSIRKCLTYKQCSAFKFGLFCFFLAR